MFFKCFEDIIFFENFIRRLLKVLIDKIKILILVRFTIPFITTFLLLGQNGFGDYQEQPQQNYPQYSNQDFGYPEYPDQNEIFNQYGPGQSILFEYHYNRRLLFFHPSKESEIQLEYIPCLSQKVLKRTCDCTRART